MEICAAELRSFYPNIKFFNIEKFGFALVEENIENPANPSIIDRLGGTIKISKIVKELPKNMPVNFTEIIKKEIKNIEKGKGKFIYGINIYPSQTNLLKKLLKAAKETLKEEGISSRYLNQDAENLSSAGSAHCQEINVVFGEEKNYLSETIAVQNIDAYSKRDYGRPKRDGLSGMLPPKLAQVMINLANPDKDTVVLDPFCGSGTISQEAILMGFDSAAYDISEKAIANTKSNTEWFKREFNPKGRLLEISKKDATTLTATDYTKFGKKIAIVTESYLGPPQRHIPTPAEAQKTLDDLENIYLDFLKTDIPEGTVIVLAIPFFNIKPSPVILASLIYKAESLRYSIPALTQKGLFYARKNQIVGRMILIFKKM